MTLNTDPFIPAQVAPGGPYGYGVWSGLPAAGPITSPFGADEGFRVAQGWGGHNAVDIGAPCGDPICAAYDGVVHFAFGTGVNQTVDENSLGTFVILKHRAPGGGVFYTGYAHMLETPLVAIGDTVTQGQQIGRVGYSGTVNPPGPDGAHLHFVVMGDRGYGYINREADDYYDPATLVGAAAIQRVASTLEQAVAQVIEQHEEDDMPQVVRSMDIAQGDIALEVAKQRIGTGEATVSEILSPNNGTIALMVVMPRDAYTAAGGN